MCVCERVREPRWKTDLVSEMVPFVSPHVRLSFYIISYSYNLKECNYLGLLLMSMIVSDIRYWKYLKALRLASFYFEHTCRFNIVLIEDLSVCANEKLCTS